MEYSQRDGTVGKKEIDLLNLSKDSDIDVRSFLIEFLFFFIVPHIRRNRQKYPYVDVLAPILTVGFVCSFRRCSENNTTPGRR